MLAPAYRMRDSEEFRHTIRRGSKGATATLVVHAVPRGEPADSSVGFVVSKAVGTAVVRNRVKRRLRHLMRARIDSLAQPVWLVIRARPAAAQASSATLATDLDRGLGEVLSAQ